MKTERLQNIPQDVEMGHIPLLNAAQSRSAEPTFAPSHSRDTLVGTTQAGRMKKRLLTAAAMGGALLGGSLSAAVAAPLMKHQRNQALQLRNEALAQLAVSQSHYNTLLASNAELDARLQAALAPTPTNPPESRAASTPPVFVVDTRCVAAERPVNQTATDALMAPSDGSSPTFFEAPLQWQHAQTRGHCLLGC